MLETGQEQKVFRALEPGERAGRRKALEERAMSSAKRQEVVAVAQWVDGSGEGMGAQTHGPSAALGIALNSLHVSV